MTTSKTGTAEVLLRRRAFYLGISRDTLRAAQARTVRPPPTPATQILDPPANSPPADASPPVDRT